MSMETRVRRKLPPLASAPLEKSPADVAMAFEQNLGVPGSVNVTLSRERLRNVLDQAVMLGAEWQRSVHAAELAAKQAAELAAKPVFPPLRVMLGFYRFRVVITGVSAFAILVAVWKNIRGCFLPTPGTINEFMCQGDGFVGAALSAFFLSSLLALGLWVASRIIVWVWRGFLVE